MDLAVECKNIQKTFGEGSGQTYALRGVDFSLKKKELVLIVGPSGSGKTTLLSIIGGILLPDGGDILIHEQNLNHLSLAQKDIYRMQNIGFIFQSFNLIPTLTARENVAIPLLLNHIDEKLALEESDQLLAQLGLGEKTHRYPRQLSTGEQQRVSIARGAINKPPLVLCDEPTSYLDAETGKSVMEHLKKIQQEKECSVIVVTHDPRIFDYADRIEKIEDGSITNVK